MRSRKPFLKLSRVKLIVVGVMLAAVAVVIAVAGSNAAPNAWLLITEPAYVIPHESSLWRFTPTVMNSGSGDWWIYGEDDENYYYFTGSDANPYVAISKTKAEDCTGFDSRDFQTWCGF